MIALLLAVRLIFLVGILVDLTAFRGQYLSMLTVNIVPDIPLAIAAVLLVCWMTASLLLPFTGVGVDAALGLLISTLFQQRIYALLAQFVVIALRISVVILLLLGMTQLLAGELSDLSEQVSWLLMGGFSALGDWGLRFTHLQSFGGLWSIVPYGVFLGLGLVIYVVVQALFTDLLLSLAVRRAERAG
jgi:hypothetical protein